MMSLNCGWSPSLMTVKKIKAPYKVENFHARTNNRLFSLKTWGSQGNLNDVGVVIVAIRV